LVWNAIAEMLPDSKALYQTLEKTAQNMDAYRAWMETLQNQYAEVKGKRQVTPSVLAQVEEKIAPLCKQKDWLDDEAGCIELIKEKAEGNESAEGIVIDMLTLRCKAAKGLAEAEIALLNAVGKLVYSDGEEAMPSKGGYYAFALGTALKWPVTAQGLDPQWPKDWIKSHIKKADPHVFLLLSVAAKMKAKGHASLDMEELAGQLQGKVAKDLYPLKKPTTPQNKPTKEENHHDKRKK
jgi:hypothetical protein